MLKIAYTHIMKIEVAKLNQTNGGRDFSYNDRAEDAITNAVCYWHDLQANGGTSGYDQRYDKLINRTRVELKISSSSGFYLEVAKGDGTPSGIFTTESNVYLTVTLGTDQGLQCMKVKLYRTAELQHWARHMLENHGDKLKTFPASDLGPGSRGFMLDYKALDDLYILGFAYERDAQGKIVFDTHNVINVPNYGRKNINKYIPQL